MSQIVKTQVERLLESLSISAYNDIQGWSLLPAKSKPREQDHPKSNCKKLQILFFVSQGKVRDEDHQVGAEMGPEMPENPGMDQVDLRK